MGWPKFINYVTLTQNEYLPIITPPVAARHLKIQCRTAVDVYVGVDPVPGNAIWTMKSNSYMEFPILDGINIIGSLVDVELGYNGTFTGGSTGWTLPTGWAYSSNTVLHNADGTGELALDLDRFTCKAGSVYRVIYTVSAWSVGTCTPKVGGASGVARGAGATYTEYIKATNAGQLTFAPTNTARFTLDDISIKEFLATNNLWMKASSGTPIVDVLYY